MLYIILMLKYCEHDRKQCQRIDIELRLIPFISRKYGSLQRVTIQQDLAATSLLPKKQPMVDDLCEAYCPLLILSFSFPITTCIISY